MLPSNRDAQLQSMQVHFKYVYIVHNGPNPDPELIQYKDYVLLCKLKSASTNNAIKCVQWSHICPIRTLVDHNCIFSWFASFLSPS